MIKKAAIADIKQIQELINSFAKQDQMLARSLNELYDNIRDFWVFTENNMVIGCASLHISWQDLAEIKSLAVLKEKQHRKIGSKLVIACLKEARKLGAKKVFALTYKPEFFKKLGFSIVDHKSLPHKIWAECINCPKFPNCQETALIKQL